MQPILTQDWHWNQLPCNGCWFLSKPYLDKNRKVDGMLRPKKWASISHTTKLDENTWIFPNEDAKMKFLNDYSRKGKNVELRPAGKISLQNFSMKNPKFSDFHARALAKIAYNLVAYVLGADIVRDSLFDKVREYIMSGAESVLISYPDTQTNCSPINIAGPPQYKTPYLPHYLSLTSTKDRRLLGMISIFGFNYVIVLCENWELTTHWLGYLYHVDRFLEIIPKSDFHKYLATDYWSIRLGPLFPLFSEDDRQLLSPKYNCMELLLGFLELDHLHAG